MPRIDVSLSPALYETYRDDDAIVVVIDVLRATSAICTAFEYGVEAIIPVSTIKEASAYREQGYVAGAERNGEQVEGFEFGNSPYSYMSEKLEGQTIVLTTTNGTRSIEIAKDAAMVVCGAFTNLTAICDLLDGQDRNILLLCAGWKNRFNLEDSLFAGAVVNNLMKRGNGHTVSDAGTCASYLFSAAKADPYRFLANSSHRRRLSKLNLKEDIKYCLSVDKTDKIPVLKDDRLVLLS